MLQSVRYGMWLQDITVLHKIKPRRVEATGQMDKQEQQGLVKLTTRGEKVQ